MASSKTAAKTPHKKIASRRSLWIGGVVVVVILAFGGDVTATQAMARGRTLPGLHVAGKSAGLLSREALTAQVQKQVDEYQAKGFEFSVGEKEAAIMPVVSAADGGPDLTYELVTFDVDATVEQALAYGRSGQWFTGAAQTIAAWLGRARVSLDANIDGDQMVSVLQKNFGQDDKPTVPTSFVDEGGVIAVHAGQRGTVLNYRSIVAQLLVDLRAGRALSTDAELVGYALFAEPDVEPASADDAQALLPKVRQLLENAPLTLTANGKEFTVNRATMLSWLTVNSAVNPPALAVDTDAVNAELATIAKDANVVAQEGKFAIENGKVKEFQVGATGWELDQAASAIALASGLLGGQKTVALVGGEVKPQTTTADTGDLGITEIIGAGKSNFAGSPVNRRHNIAVGAAAVNGTLIKAGEEFSLVKTLGTIDASTGYRSELVIKGNKTTPEFGGGLCQIGTTTFRAALASGVPILERKSHSYRVRYYEPAGTDATIYDPKPDFRFLNDTGHAILIQTHIDGDNVTFEFWGTKDGRVAQQSTPKVTNIVVPPPMKIIETTDLKPGVKKCTEIAHNGADAVFTYTVTYADGTVKREDFKSHYKPWQAQCLLGVKKETPSTNANTNTSANSNTNTSADVPITNSNVNDSI